MKKVLALAVIVVLVVGIAWTAQPRDSDLLSDVSREVVFVTVEIIEPGTDASEALLSEAVQEMELEESFLPANAVSDDNPPGEFITSVEPGMVITSDMIEE